MRFPRFSRKPGRRTAPLTWDRIRFYLLGLAVLFLAFLAGLYLFFPTRALQERVEREFSGRTGATLRIGRLDLVFPPAFEAQDVRISGTRTLELSSLRVRPLWLTLFGKSPAADFDARLLGGEISGRARRNGPVEVRAQQITFIEKLEGATSLEISGVLGKGSFAGVLPPAAGENRFELHFDSLQLTGLEPLGISDGNMALGRVICRGIGRGNSYRIERLEATGGELLVTGNGSLMLSRPVEQSRLNLSLTLRPSANIDRTLRDLLDLFATPGRDGSYSLRLSGTLATPVFAK